MRPLVRSLFLLSLAAAPVVAAAPSASSVFVTSEVTSATPPKAVSGPLKDVFVRSEVDDLTVNVETLRRQVADLQERNEARERALGDPNNHSLWP